MEKYITSIKLQQDTKSDIKTELIDKSKAESFEEKKSKRQRERHSIRFYFLNIILGIVIAGVLSVILIIMLCPLTTIEYTGNTNCNIEEVEKRLLDVPNRDNSVYVSLLAMFKKYDDIQFVQSVKISLKDRNTILVSIKERELLGIFDMGGKYVYFNSQGEVSEISSIMVWGLPTVSGIKLSNCKRDNPLPIEDIQRNSLINLLVYLKAEKINPDSIVYEEDGTFGFFLGNIFVDLGIPFELERKCERLPYILPNIEGQSGVLHLEEWGTESTDIIFEKTY